MELNTKILFVILGFVLVDCVQNCTRSTKISNLNKKVDSLMIVNKTLADKKYISNLVELEGYRTSYRLLYDQNAIVRTTIRPDDKMHEYQQIIEKLSK